jgi:hypothetical protein
MQGVTGEGGITGAAGKERMSRCILHYDSDKGTPFFKCNPGARACPRSHFCPLRCPNPLYQVVL